ncbi:MAG: adenylate/guanylate cyclase domain-containing protein [Candidatus Kapaibacteriota bacterium]
MPNTKSHTAFTKIKALQSLLDMGHFEQLEHDCLEILESNESYNQEFIAFAHLMLSQSYWRRGNKNKGQISSNIAMVLMNEHGAHWSSETCSQIYGNAGILHMQIGMFEKASEYIKLALELCIKDANTLGMTKYLMNLGVLHYYMANYQEALDCYKQGLELALQLGDEIKIASCETNLGMTYVSISEYEQALIHYKSALKREEALGNVTAIASLLGNMGVVYSNLGKYTIALEFYTKAMNLDEQLGITKNHAKYYGNMGVVYGSVSDFQKALECYQKALKIEEDQENILGVIRQLGNIGTINKDLGDLDQALKYNQQALVLLKEYHNPDQEMYISKNMGEIYRALGDIPNALHHFTQQMNLAKNIGIKSELASAFGNLGLLYVTIKDYDNAHRHFIEAITISNELGIKAEEAGWKSALGDLYGNPDFELYDSNQSEDLLKEALSVHKTLGQKREEYRSHYSLSNLYESLDRVQEAFHHFKLYHGLEKEVMNEQAKKQAIEIELIRKIEQIERENKETMIRFEEKERILHDILPIEIANRIVSGETMIAEQHDNVSIIFADIVSFTETALRLKPAEVVGTLNDLFTEFDSLALELGIEKIKTLGDAYMGACGIPTAREDHAVRMTEFAFRIMNASKNHRFPGQDIIKIRVGLHCGPVIAGVIGGHKYTYDLWGDSVNTASRMESQGQRNEVHVSEDFVRTLCNVSQDEEVPESHLLTFGRISIQDRGKIDIKGRGSMRTFYLQLI